MAKVSELLEINEMKGRYFGLELEAEGKNLPNVHDDLWKMEDDGSLRGRFPDTRCEYVIRKPIQFNQVKDALAVIQKAANKEETVWDFSFRTSFHVHINVSDLEEELVKNIVYTYRLFESTLSNYCWEERLNNRFCLRAADCDHVEELTRILMKDGIRGVAYKANNGDFRYSALNFCSLLKYGTLEFRMKEGTEDFDDLYRWVKLLNNLVEYAISKKNVQEIADEMAELSPIGFCRLVLGETDRFVEKDFYKDVSLSFALPFIYSAAVKGDNNAKKQDNPAPVQAREQLRQAVIRAARAQEAQRQWVILDDVQQMPELGQGVQVRAAPR